MDSLCYSICDISQLGMSGLDRCYCVLSYFSEAFGLAIYRNLVHSVIFTLCLRNVQRMYPVLQLLFLFDM
jgi:hypothetical protein